MTIISPTSEWLPLANASTVLLQNNYIQQLKMVKHIVTFQFEGSPAERLAVAQSFRDALNALPSQIPQLKSIEVGINENPAESWDLVLIAQAETLEDVAAYSAHPAHVAAVQIIAPHKKARACVDYTISE